MTEQFHFSPRAHACPPPPRPQPLVIPPLLVRPSPSTLPPPTPPPLPPHWWLVVGRAVFPSYQWLHPWPRSLRRKSPSSCYFQEWLCRLLQTAKPDYCLFCVELEVTWGRVGTTGAHCVNAAVEMWKMNCVVTCENCWLSLQGHSEVFGHARRSVCPSIGLRQVKVQQETSKMEVMSWTSFFYCFETVMNMKQLTVKTVMKASKDVQLWLWVSD